VANYPHLVAEQRAGIQLTLSNRIWCPVPLFLVPCPAFTEFELVGTDLNAGAVWRAGNASRVSNPKTIFGLHRRRWRCMNNRPGAAGYMIGGGAAHST